MMCSALRLHGGHGGTALEAPVKGPFAISCAFSCIMGSCVSLWLFDLDMHITSSQYLSTLDIPEQLVCTGSNHTVSVYLSPVWEPISLYTVFPLRLVHGDKWDYIASCGIRFHP